MKIVLRWVLALLLAAGTLAAEAADAPAPPPAAAPAPAPTPAAAAAATAAQSWLEMVDAGKYGDSWSSASPLFKSRVKKAEWEQGALALRTRTGPLVSRAVKATGPAKAVPGAPDGDYMTIEFATQYQNAPPAAEYVTMTLDRDGQWRAAGYGIQDAETAAK